MHQAHPVVTLKVMNMMSRRSFFRTIIGISIMYVMLLTIYVRRSDIRPYYLSYIYRISNVKYPVVISKHFNSKSIARRHNFSANYGEFVGLNTTDYELTEKQETFHQDPACGVKYAIIVFEEGKDSSHLPLLLHKQQNVVSIFTSASELSLLYGVDEAGIREGKLTVQDVLISVRTGRSNCWRNLKHVIYCRNTTLLNVKNVFDMLERQGECKLGVCLGRSMLLAPFIISPLLSAPFIFLPLVPFSLFLCSFSIFFPCFRIYLLLHAPF